MVNVRSVEPGGPLSLPEGEVAESRADAEFRTGLRRQIESLAQEQGRSMFVATENSRVLAVGLSRVGRVLSVEGDEILISNSHAKHKADPDVFLSEGGWYTFAIDPASNRILGAGELKPPLLLHFKQSTSAFPINLSYLPRVKLTDVRAFFSRLRRQPHIAFQYPTDGCWVRAHEMARLIEGYFDPNPKDVVAKIWNFGDLRVDTDNNPYCSVPWEWHVAPVVRVSKELLVIDPALFEEPVSIDDWKSRQSDSSAKHFFTSRHAYNYEKGLGLLAESPGETQQQLRDFWGHLLSSILLHGPLPYRCGLTA